VDTLKSDTFQIMDSMSYKNMFSNNGLWGSWKMWFSDNGVWG